MLRQQVAQDFVKTATIAGAALKAIKGKGALLGPAASRHAAAMSRRFSGVGVGARPVMRTVNPTVAARKPMQSRIGMVGRAQAAKSFARGA